MVNVVIIDYGMGNIHSVYKSLVKVIDKNSNVKVSNSLNDINKVELDNIVYFLSHYKDNEIDKHVVIGEIYDKHKALEIIERFSV